MSPPTSRNTDKTIEDIQPFFLFFNSVYVPLRDKIITTYTDKATQYMLAHESKPNVLRSLIKTLKYPINL
jgi:hypothetical protein